VCADSYVCRTLLHNLISSIYIKPSSGVNPTGRSICRTCTNSGFVSIVTLSEPRLSCVDLLWKRTYASIQYSNGLIFDLNQSNFRPMSAYFLSPKCKTKCHVRLCDQKGWPENYADSSRKLGHPNTFGWYCMHNGFLFI
jgi:hypothetical protein